VAFAGLDYRQVDLVPDLPGDVFRNANTPGSGHRLNPGGDVNSIAMHMPVDMYYITDVQTNSQVDMPAVGMPVVSFVEGGLYFYGAVGRFDCAAEFDKKRITSSFYFLPIVLPEQRPEDVPVFLQQLERQRLVQLGERTVPNDVSKHDRSQASHCSKEPVPFRKPIKIVNICGL
jgi:hypothetical protein